MGAAGSSNPRKENAAMPDAVKLVELARRTRKPVNKEA
jgi:hypothetical protein